MIQLSQGLYSHLKTADISLYNTLDALSSNQREISGDVARVISNVLRWRSVPEKSNSSGNPGQIAYDALGNFYFCYFTNKWARIGPGGYSNNF